MEKLEVGRGVQERETEITKHNLCPFHSVNQNQLWDSFYMINIIPLKFSHESQAEIRINRICNSVMMRNVTIIKNVQVLPLPHPQGLT